VRGSWAFDSSVNGDLPTINLHNMYTQQKVPPDLTPRYKAFELILTSLIITTKRKFEIFLGISQLFRKSQGVIRIFAVYIIRVP
jgi:hypothetical protein